MRGKDFFWYGYKFKVFFYLPLFFYKEYVWGKLKKNENPE